MSLPGGPQTVADADNIRHYAISTAAGPCHFYEQTGAFHSKCVHKILQLLSTSVVFITTSRFEIVQISVQNKICIIDFHNLHVHHISHVCHLLVH